MRRLLVVSTTFYPHPVVGAVRMTQWARHLPEFGWQPIVLCRDYGYRASPKQLASATHPSVEVHYLDASAEQVSPPKAEVRPDSARSMVARLARTAFVPDVSVRFWQRVRARIEAAVEEFAPDAVLTTSPPHGNHIVGMWLVQAHAGLPWVADFRDPFTIDPRAQPAGIARLRWPAFRRYERRIYERASLILHAIEVEHRWARRKYPWAADRMLHLPNGCPTELAEGAIAPTRTESGRRSIRAVGASGSEESLALARAIAALVKRGEDLELRLVGPKPDSAEAIRDLLGDRAILTGRVSHERALAEVAGANVLVCTVGLERSRTLLMSSKLFEFFAAGAPVIVVNPTFSDRHFLRRRPWLPVRTVSLSPLESASTEALADALSWSLSGSAQANPEVSRSFAKEFSRRNQVRLLAARLDAVAARVERSNPIRTLRCRTRPDEAVY